jgi:hypothetical protein
MPVELKISNDGDTLEMLASGDINQKQILAAAYEIYESPVLSAIKYHFVDYSFATSLELDDVAAAENFNLDALMAEKYPNMRTAVVAPTDPIFELCHAWELQVTKFSMTGRAFREREAAIAWLYGTD